MAPQNVALRGLLLPLLVIAAGCEQLGAAARGKASDAGALNADGGPSPDGDAGARGFTSVALDHQPEDAAAAKASPPKASAVAPSAARKLPPLNGLPAGAACVTGSEGNGGCASGSECANARCTCYNGWTSCGGRCLDLSRDPYNCNACGRECAWGQRCVWGRCD